MDSRYVKLLFPLFLWAVASLLYYHFFFSKAHVEVEIEVSQRTWFKIYWAGEGELFSEKRMSRVRVFPGQTNYKFFLTDLKKVEKLRIGPHQYVGKSTITWLRISQESVEDILLKSPEQFSVLQPIDQIGSHSAAGGGLQTVSTGKDPNFLFEPKLVGQPVNWQQELVRVAALGIVIFLMYWGTSVLVVEFRFVPLCISIILVLAATMAVISMGNVHPDEYVHVAASQYYSENWLPPVIGDESIRESYSRYGHSRLHTDEVYYVLCGKFANIVEPLHLNKFVKYRMFNVFLLFLVLMYVFRNQSARLLALPFLVSPQIWYLFSYCNGDALGIVITFFTGCQVILGDSLLNRYIRSRGGFWWLLKAVAIGLFFGSLLLLKKNYWTYVGVLVAVAAINWWRCSDVFNRKTRLLRLALVALMALSVLASKKVVDFYVNGPDRSEKIAAVRAEVADPMFSPASPLGQKHTFLDMKDRGVTLERVIVIDRWFEKTFWITFGVYGYFTISCYDVYYDLIRWTGVG